VREHELAYFDGIWMRHVRHCYKIASWRERACKRGRERERKGESRGVRERPRERKSKS